MGRRVPRVRREKAAGTVGTGAILPLILWVLSTTTSVGQGVSLLQTAERLADRGDVEGSQQALGRWESEFGSSAPMEERARAWFLAARLAEDGAEAEMGYLRVVIDGSSTSYADDALLRLGHYWHARGNHAKAIEYLGRLRRDYPTSEHGVEALVWIARSSRAQGDHQRACGAVQQGLRELPPAGAGEEIESLLRAEEEACASAEGVYTVQVAAFRESEAAQRLASDLLTRGFDAWVLIATPQDPLHRVRVGRELLKGEAEAVAGRLSAAGYAPFLVSQPTRAGGG